MGALYVMAGITFVGIVIDLFSTAAGEGEVGTYDYHFAPGVGAVFGSYR